MAVVRGNHLENVWTIGLTKSSGIMAPDKKNNGKITNSAPNTAVLCVFANCAMSNPKQTKLNVITMMPITKSIVIEKFSGTPPVASGKRIIPSNTVKTPKTVPNPRIHAL